MHLCFRNRPQRNRKSCLEEVKVIEYEKHGEQHVENHADENDEIKKLRVSSLFARFVFCWFVHSIFWASATL
jgi:hypothetical protein